jgi:MoaA/NifB/PqqE/SkfB family radical SAM enzyme
MCDIWKDNKNLKQLNEQDIEKLLTALSKFGTQEVVMSGGEALLNTNFFRLCEILKRSDIKITLLSTGLLLQKHATQLLKFVDNIIVSLDGNEVVHDLIRNIPGAFRKLKESVQYLKSLHPACNITARTVIHKMNFRHWPSIIDAAKNMGLNQISFLPADVSSHAFNREVLWEASRQQEVLLSRDDLTGMKNIIDEIIVNYQADFDTKFIAESPEKLRKIYLYYAAFYGLNAFPYKKCNAPWVSAVIEADGNVRPCFFHEVVGNIRSDPFEVIVNNSKAYNFRKSLNTHTNETCAKCVCYLNLQASVSVR